LHFGQQLLFAGAQFLAPVLLAFERGQRGLLGDALPLVEQRGADRVLLAHLAEGRVARAALLQDLQFGRRRKLAPFLARTIAFHAAAPVSTLYSFFPRWEEGILSSQNLSYFRGPFVSLRSEQYSCGRVSCYLNHTNRIEN
jgi:hypothetical protein